jgi:hypothetical protein
MSLAWPRANSPQITVGKTGHGNSPLVSDAVDDPDGPESDVDDDVDEEVAAEVALGFDALDRDGPKFVLGRCRWG